MTRTERLARRLGLDNNPLRRRTDKIAVCLGAGLLAAFLSGAPLLSIAAAGWAGHAAAVEQRAQRDWQQVSAVLLRNAPATGPFAGSLYGGAWVPATWTAPDGRTRNGEVDVTTGLAAGQTVPIWVTIGLPGRPSADPRCGGGPVRPRGGRRPYSAGNNAGIPGRRDPLGNRPAPARGLGRGLGAGRAAVDQTLLVEGISGAGRRRQ